MIVIVYLLLVKPVVEFQRVPAGTGNRTVIIGSSKLHCQPPTKEDSDQTTTTTSTISTLGKLILLKNGNSFFVFFFFVILQ